MCDQQHVASHKCSFLFLLLFCIRFVIFFLNCHENCRHQQYIDTKIHFTIHMYVCTHSKMPRAKATLALVLAATLMLLATGWGQLLSYMHLYFMELTYCCDARESAYWHRIRISVQRIEDKCWAKKNNNKYWQQEQRSTDVFTPT